VEGLCSLVLGQTSFEIARDRNANKGTHLAEESVRRRSDPTTDAVPLNRCVVELRPSNGQIGSYGGRPTLTDVSQKSASRRLRLISYKPVSG
jgi:hypothetical protein